MGGMAALIPSRRDEAANAKALDGVRADKEREVQQGYDGTWVAHPDLVPVARDVFERGLKGAPNQLERQREDVAVSARDLLDLGATPGQATQAGLFVPLGQLSLVAGSFVWRLVNLAVLLAGFRCWERACLPA